MDGIYEITIIGRGGQGSKTASEVLAYTAMSEGKYIQSFSEYGPERTGAPVTSYVRISENPITIHCAVTKPQLVVILDQTLLDMAQGYPDAIIIVNTKESPAAIRTQIGAAGRICTVDCTGISMEIIGKNIPNTPMLGAIVRASGILPKAQVIADLRSKLEHKIGKEAMDRNVQSLERAYQEVREA